MIWSPFSQAHFYLVIFLGALKIEFTINWTDSVQKAFRTIPYGPGREQSGLAPFQSASSSTSITHYTTVIKY